MRAARRLHESASRALLLLPLLLGAGCGDAEAPGPAGVPATYDPTGAARVAVAHPDAPPSLVVVVIDALRHDALPLGEEGASGARMPHLAALARRGVACANAVAAAPWTLPSVTSLLTGRLPSAHGLSAPEARVHLVDAITTYAEILRTTYGYETVACTAGPWFVGTGESVLQGFERRTTGFGLQGVEDRLGDWARSRDANRPFFLLLHTEDAHDPYGAANHPWHGTPPDVRADPTLVGPAADPAEIFRHAFLDAGARQALGEALGRSRLDVLLKRYAAAGYAADPRPDLAAELAAAYWDGVRWTDGLLGRAVRFLEGAGLLANALLVVTTDHGEGFGEHGSLGHGRLLYDELVHVPLVLVGPPPFDGGRVVEGGIGLVDVLPTFLDRAGCVPLRGVEGRSRLALLAGDDESCRPVLSEERLGYLNTGEACDRIRASARTPAWTYVVTYDLETGEAREEAYDRRRDPGERDDLGGGTGRLPEGLVFDECLCEAIEAIRGRIWRAEGGGGDDGTQIPYGASNRPPSTPPPSPCRRRAP